MEKRVNLRNSVKDGNVFFFFVFFLIFFKLKFTEVTVVSKVT